MKTLKITKNHLDTDNYYIGDNDVTNYDGNIEIEGNLGLVKFKTSLVCTGHLVAKAGADINAGDNIKAGSGIEAELSIDAKTISSNLRIFAGVCSWKTPTDEEKQIRAKLIKGEVAYGELIEPTRTTA